MTCSLKLYFIHFLILSFSFSQQTLKNVYNKNKNNIVEIITNNSYGTGFFYQNNGIVLTASHIVNGSKTVKIKKENKITNRNWYLVWQIISYFERGDRTLHCQSVSISTLSFSVN